MGTIKAIRNEADYDAALARVDALMNAEPGGPEGEELDVLADLVEHYEDKHVPLGFPSAIAAIEFRIDQAGLSARTGRQRRTNGALAVRWNRRSSAALRYGGVTAPRRQV